MAQIEQELIDAAYPYWEAEAEIARRFYETASRDDHIFYLRAQLWKELNPVDGYFNGLHRELAALVERFPLVDREISRHQYHFLLMQLTQEFNHYVVLADVFEHLVGRPISRDDTVQLPEERKLGDLRRDFVRNGSVLDRAAVGLTEGGGARLFREGAKLHGSEINDMTARAMKVIYDDEENHYREQARDAVALVRNDANLARIKETIRAVSRQRVNMRNEMFRSVMTGDEIESFIVAKQAELARGRHARA